MQPPLCSRCQKNVAVVFIRKVENGKTVNEGLCLKCAKELNIKPVEDLMHNMGITDDDIDGLSAEMTEALNGIEEIPVSDEPSDDNGKTATFPFLNKLFGGNPTPPTPPPAEAPRPGREAPKGTEGGPSRGQKRKFLESYCQDLTGKAKAGRLDRIVGRTTELERVVQILNRRQKNNPCLIGEPGVGKTAIAEGLAQKIVDGDVPYKLKDKEVWLLDLTSLVAGTQFRGQFESRMKGLIDEIRKQGNIILFIDEVHSIVGAGDAEGSMNAANILKPALSRGEIQVIGATTFAEYRKHIEKDSALERRFQPVTVSEPSIGESIEIMKGIAHYYEEYHCVKVSEEMCRQAVILSERYITDRFLPDKAIDLLDEACSDVNLKNKDIARTAEIKKELEDLAGQREKLLSAPSGGDSQDYEQLAALRTSEFQLEEEQKRLADKGWPELTLENLARVIELWTKIPASSIKEDEFQRLSKLNERLKAHIIGQDEAIDAVCAAIKRNRVGISAKRKPVSFIFVGSTGVGKTELVKRLAADLFDSPESLIRLDMSEFMEKHAVSRIIGSPPGYVGYDEAGQLTEKIRRKPYSVVLFDEIEKAHPDVMNILLQILDDGHITDAHGRNVNFENTVIIMTTNAGSDRKTASVGFNRSLTEQGKDSSMKALNEFLRPEFINRIDAVVSFNRLSEENFVEIARLMMTELKESMADRGYTLAFDEAILAYLAKKSYSVAYGARNLRRLIQTEVEDAITSILIDNYDKHYTLLSVTAEEEKVKITPSN